MLAPSRVPPCCMISPMVKSNISMKERGPEAVPPVEWMGSPLGRRREKLMPVPPPYACTSTASERVLKMLRRLSSIGRTKHALPQPSFRPKFRNVGLLGRKSRLSMIPLYLFSHFTRSSDFFSSPATLWATRSHSFSQVSPSAKYLFCSIFKAFSVIFIFSASWTFTRLFHTPSLTSR